MRLLLDHREVDQVLPVSSSKAGTLVAEDDGGFGPDFENKLPPDGRYLDVDTAVGIMPDAVFAALPHGASASTCAPFFQKSVVLDLSADFRLGDAAAHETAYGSPPPFPDLRDQAVYGLAEVYRERIKRADIIAVPGCYPTCTLLPVLPLAAGGLIEGPIIVNALSGISGAGRSPKENSLFVERSENAGAYSPGLRHRHLPEILQELRNAGSAADLFFTPHLVPMRRGMIATITAIPSGGAGRGTASAKEAVSLLGDVLENAYRDSPFVTLRGGELPTVRDVIGSNRCDIGWAVEEYPGSDSGRAVYLFSALDNLVKGAAGQAVQAFNLRFGFDETTGLPLRGIA